MDEPSTNCSELVECARRQFGAQYFNSPTVVLNCSLERGTVAFDEWIPGAETVLLACPRSHSGRPHLLLCLAAANEKVHRYDTVSHQKSDLDDIIACLTEALLFLFHISNCASRFDSVGATLFIRMCACSSLPMYTTTLRLGIRDHMLSAPSIPATQDH